MQNRLCFALAVLLLPLHTFCAVADADDADDYVDEGHHHHHKRHHHKKKVIKKESKDPAPKVISTPPKGVAAVKVTVPTAAVQSQNSVVAKMKAIEAKLAKKEAAQAQAKSQGHLLVNGPLPADFNERFAQAVGHATGSDASAVTVTDSSALEDGNGVVEVNFVASPKVTRDVEGQAADPSSKLASGNMHSFLVAKSEDKEESGSKTEHSSTKQEKHHASAMVREEVEHEATPVEEKGIDIDTQMPYGDLEPFGREDTAQELTESSVHESDAMVDQLERAEVAEEKRSVFRALTRLRGAAITSFDGVARSQTGNIDEYNKVHKWRNSHPLHHLADEESDVSKWAFPDNADF